MRSLASKLLLNNNSIGRCATTFTVRRNITRSNTLSSRDNAHIEKKNITPTPQHIGSFPIDPSAKLIDVSEEDLFIPPSPLSGKLLELGIIRDSWLNDVLKYARMHRRDHHIFTVLTLAMKSLIQENKGVTYKRHDDDISRLIREYGDALKDRNGISPPMLLRGMTDMVEIIAYHASCIMHQTAISATIFEQMRHRIGDDFQFNSILDIGHGSGPASFAFFKLVKDFEELRMVTSQPNPQIRKFQEALFDEVQSFGAFPKALDWAKIGTMPKATTEDEKFHIVFCQNQLNTFDSQTQKEEYVKSLWDLVSDRGMLIFVEHGTSAGFELVAGVRDRFAKLFRSDPNLGHVFAPCSHDQDCPLFKEPLEKRIMRCSFEKKLKYSRMMPKRQTARNVEKRYEFSYCALRKGVPRPAYKFQGTPTMNPNIIDPNLIQDNIDTAKEASYYWPRVVTFMNRLDGHCKAVMCTHKGELEQHTFSKVQGGNTYSLARSTRGGDLMPFDPKVREPKTPIVAPCPVRGIAANTELILLGFQKRYTIKHKQKDLNSKEPFNRKPFSGKSFGRKPNSREQDCEEEQSY